MENASNEPSIKRIARFYHEKKVKAPLSPRGEAMVIKSAFVGGCPTLFFGNDKQNISSFSYKTSAEMVGEKQEEKQEGMDSELKTPIVPMVEYRGLRSDLIPGVFRQNGFRVVYAQTKEAIIKWNRCQWKLIFGRSRPWCSINHIPLSCRLGCKDKCAKQIMKCESISKNFVLLPHTFVLPKDTEKCAAQVDKDTELTGRVPITIKKPTSSSRGRGISIHVGIPPLNNKTTGSGDSKSNSDSEQIINGSETETASITNLSSSDWQPNTSPQTQEYTTSHTNSEPIKQSVEQSLTKGTTTIKPKRRHKNFLCQYYIQKPMLLLNHKFDIRVYVLVTSSSPLRAYVYRDGIVRMAPGDYKEIYEDLPANSTTNREISHTECQSDFDEESDYETSAMYQSSSSTDDDSSGSEITENHTDTPTLEGDRTVVADGELIQSIKDITAEGLCNQSSDVTQASDLSVSKGQKRTGVSKGEVGVTTKNIDLLDHLTNVSLAVKSSKYRKPLGMYTDTRTDGKKVGSDSRFQFDSHQWTLKEFMDYADEVQNRKKMHIPENEQFRELVGDCGNCLCRCKEFTRSGPRDGSGHVVFDSKHIWNEITRVVKYTILAAKRSFESGSKKVNREMKKLVREGKGRYAVGALQGFNETLPNTPFNASETCFELFGFDVMFCRCGTARLIEVNISPSAAPHTPIDRAIKIPMYSQAFNIIGFGRKDMGVEKNQALINSIEEFYRAAGTEFIRVLPDPNSEVESHYTVTTEEERKLCSWIYNPSFSGLPPIDQKDVKRILDHEKRVRVFEGLSLEPIAQCLMEYRCISSKVKRSRPTARGGKKRVLPPKKKGENW